MAGSRKKHEPLRAPAAQVGGLREPFERLVDSGLRLNEMRSAEALHEVLISEVTELSGAGRVLLVLETPEGLRPARSMLPRGEDEQQLLKAIAPWLDEARRTGEASLRHGPEGAEPVDQRSCLIAPLIARREPLGYLYADIDGALGRFHDADRELLATLASQAAVALANLRLAAGLEQEVAERTAQLEQRAGELAVINSIQQGMAAELSFQGIVDLVGDKLCEVFKTGDLGIHWGDEATHEIRFLYQVERGVRNYPKPIRRFDDKHPLVVEIAAGRPVVINTPAEALALGEYVVPGTVPPLSSVRIPIVGGNRVPGAIVLKNHERENAFGEAEVRLLTTIAASMGTALENARLHGETQQALEQQTATADILRVISESPTDVQPVFDAIADRAMRLCGANIGGVARFDGEWVQLVAFRGVSAQAEAAVKGSFPLRPGRGAITARAIFEAAPVQCPDVLADPDYELKEATRLAGYRANMAVPMLRDGKAIGAIAICREQPGEFPQKQIDLLRTFADQAVIAIENVRLFNETREALERQTATAEVLQVISSSVSDAAPVFDKIIQSCQKLFGVEYANVALIGEDGLMHLMQDSRGPADERLANARTLIQAQFPRPVRDSIHGYAIHKGKVVHFADVLNGPEVPKGLRRSAELNGNYSALFAPMFWEGKGIGALAVHRMPPAPFTDNDISLLKTFADQAVIAIQNARLFNETQEALRAADRDRRDPEGDRQFAVGRAARVRRHRAERLPADRRVLDRGGARLRRRAASGGVVQHRRGRQRGAEARLPDAGRRTPRRHAPRRRCQSPIPRRSRTPRRPCATWRAGVASGPS